MNTKPFGIETPRPTFSAKDRADWIPQPKETKDESYRKHLQYAEERLNTLKNGEPNHVKFLDPPTSLVGAEGEYKPKEPKYKHCFNCGNDEHLADQCCFVKKGRELTRRSLK